jgi:membrane protease subunit (stomatin/prohibitin family)
MAIIDVVKWDGHPEIFAWKFHSDALSTGSQLIVNESQEAYLVSGGVYDGPFGAGRHTLETENLPGLRILYNLPYGGKSPFTAEVWFVNLTSNLNVKWGTTDPIQLQDPKFGIMVPVRSYGQYGIEIADSKKFLLKLVGSLKIFDKNNITTYFRGNLITQIKNEIARTIIHLNISVIEVSTLLLEISNEMKIRLGDHFAEYGLALKEFNIHSINVPEGDPAIATLKNALAKRAEMGIVGYNYQQERGFDVLQTAAGNEGTAGGVMGAGIGLGAGVGIGSGIGSAMGGVASNLSAVSAAAPEPAVAPAPAASTHTMVEKIEILKQLAELKNSGILTAEEFETEKKKIMG